MPSYIQKRRLRYYAVLEIPAALRPQFQGKPRFVKSLDTQSLTTAQRRVGEVIRVWKSDLDRARKAAGRPLSDTEADAAYFLRALRRAPSGADRAAVLERITEAADAIGAASVEHIGQAPSSAPEARDFYALATGTVVATLDHLDEWLGATAGTAKTLDMHRAEVKRFAATFPLLRDVDRAAVRRWVTGLMAGDRGLAPKTMGRLLSSLRGYWRYLQTINIVPEEAEPFAKLGVASVAKRGDKRQPFEPADVVRLLGAAEAAGDGQLADLIRLGMWTGCRIEELCALKAADVGKDSFRVVAAKTGAGVRVVPIHDELAPVIVRLLADKSDAYLLHGLSFNKYGDRSNAVGKRFGRLRTAEGFGPTVVYHSIRKTFVTSLENAGVPENVVADLVGHDKPTLTFGLYSGGATLAVKRAALAKLTYPASGGEPKLEPNALKFQA